MITGGALRLGRAIALGLAEAGADIVLHYRSSREAAEETAGALADLGTGADLVQADLSDPGAAHRLLDQASEGGPIDMLVNSASRFPSGRLGTLDLSELTDVLALNAWAPFVLGRCLAQRVRGDHDDGPGDSEAGAGGAVVNMLDTRIIGEDLSHAAYHLSKRMLADLTRMSAIEFAPYVRVNAVAPGYILPPPDQDSAYLERRAREIPLRRPGSVADVVAAVVYLMSAEYVTGQTIFVDGGQNLAPERPTP